MRSNHNKFFYKPPHLEAAVPVCNLWNQSRKGHYVLMLEIHKCFSFKYFPLFFPLFIKWNLSMFFFFFKLSERLSTFNLIMQLTDKSNLNVKHSASCISQLPLETDKFGKLQVKSEPWHYNASEGRHYLAVFFLPFVCELCVSSRPLQITRNNCIEMGLLYMF